MKVNVCFLIHPIRIYNLLGNEILKPILLILHFFPYTPSNHLLFLTLPQVFFLGARVLSILFLHLVLFLTPPFFGFCKRHLFFHEGYFSSYNHELWSSTMMLNSHELNQNNKPKAKACNLSIVLDYEMKLKYDIEVCLCLGTQCSLCSS